MGCGARAWRALALRTYLASNLQKTVFAEHAVDDDDGKKGKKKAVSPIDSPASPALFPPAGSASWATARVHCVAHLEQNLRTDGLDQPSIFLKLFACRRVDQDERVNVLPPVQALLAVCLCSVDERGVVQAAVDKLLSSGSVSRVDLDETEGKKRPSQGSRRDTCYL